MFMIFDSQVVRNIMIPNESLLNGWMPLWKRKTLDFMGKLGTYVTDESLSNYNDFVELR
ncbi:MAG: hypothetical protein CM15mP64_7480 [Candidatus Neomarinimicrobiota bacterium]|nr:MAG: hypothetical protein CM15mP64_7480 [Candidatus Neomarinimicrobiota bacterium]